MKNFIFILSILFSFTATAQLTYEQGFFKPSYYQDGVNINKQKASELIATYDISKHHWDIGKKNELVSGITGLVATGGLIYFLVSDSEDDATGLDVGISVATLGAAVASLVTALKANKSYKLAFKTYNEKKNKSIGFEADFKVYPNKLAIAFTF